MGIWYLLKRLPTIIRGFESAIARLDAMGLIDPKRVGAIGFSRTSYYVESALIEDPQLFLLPLHHRWYR